MKIVSKVSLSGLVFFSACDESEQDAKFDADTILHDGIVDIKVLRTVLGGRATHETQEMAYQKNQVFHAPV